MDYVDVFERQGALADELLVLAFALPQDRFTAPGAGGGPSLRDLLTEWLEMQRRAVHVSLRGHPWHPLPAGQTALVTGFAQAWGGFRMTLLETLEDTYREDFAKRVPWTSADGTTTEVSVDEVLAHLALHGARMMGLVAARIREQGGNPPRIDLLP